MATETKHTIPKTQRAFVLPKVGGPASLVLDHPVVQPDALLPGQCLVNISHSGVCHSDLGIRKGYIGQIAKENLIGGHEAIGTVVAIAEHTVQTHIKLGQRVGLKYVAKACYSCEICLKGSETHCPEFVSHGNTMDGTFCEYAVAYMDTVTPIPDSISSADASAIMCAGLTVHAALRQANLSVSEWVLILGAGGGLGHLAVQYASVMGYRVVAVDTGDDKRDQCLKLGAAHFLDFKTADVTAEVFKITGRGAHAVLVTGGGSSVYAAACNYLRPTGTLLVVALPPDAQVAVPVVMLCALGLNIKGVLVGNRRYALEAIELAAAGKVKVNYTVRGLSELNEIYDEMDKGKIVGRVVLDIQK